MQEECTLVLQPFPVWLCPGMRGTFTWQWWLKTTEVKPRHQHWFLTVKLTNSKKLCKVTLNAGVAIETPFLLATAVRSPVG